MTKKILFDESHNETWTIEKYRAFSNSLENPLYYSYTHISEYVHEILGYSVLRNIDIPISKSILADISVFVIAHPADPRIHKGCGGQPIFANQEIEAIKEYVEEGGSLFVLYEYEVNRWKSNINELLSCFDIKLEDNIVIAQYESPSGPQMVTQFATRSFSQHPICNGLRQVSYYAGCSVSSNLITSDRAVIGPNGETLMLAAQFGNGRVCVIGDTDLFALPYVKQYDNFSLLVNIFQWLTGVDTPKLFGLESIHEKEVYRPIIFISYAREDAEVVHKLYEMLEFYGCSPWLDKESIIPGEDFEIAIMRGIKNCDFFVPCISKNSIDKRGFLQKEIRTALSIAEGMLDNDIYIIPVRLDNTTPHETLAKYQWIDISDRAFIRKLMAAIISGISRRIR